jgi:Rps23 Pro-64 3,4-dihydroxylase Tpa1-like proline 4-hydroxylase
VLHPDLDIAALAATFAASRRLVIPRIFEPDYAEQVYAGLLADVPWRLSFRDNRLPGKAAQKSLTREDFAALGREGARALHNTVVQQAAEGFQYLYESFDIAGGRAAGEAPGSVLYDVLDDLRGEDFLGFARRLTGETAINDVYAHATRYLPGHFLKEHEDVTEWDDRRYAYVLGFTPGWPADAGGLLYFHDEDGVAATFMPGYNTLTIFAVPVRHSVGLVAPWVRQPRLAVTGWLRVADGGA